MLEIRSINAFFQLSEHHRTAILKELKTKIRLEDWLVSLNKKENRALTKAIEVKCRTCDGTGKITLSPRNSKDIHPSGITRCLKKVWMDCSGYTEQAEEYVPARLRMIFDIGSAWHNVMQAYGARGAWGHGENYHAEAAIDPDEKNADGDSVHPWAEVYWIRGHVDAVIDPYIVNVPGLGVVGIKVIHEYKTINSNGFSKLTRPKPDHKWQATVYSVCVDAPIVVYLYTNKDTSLTADFPIAYDHTLMQEIEKKIYRIQELVDAGTPPPWEETSNTLNPYECSECGYLASCRPPQKVAKRRR